MYEGCTSDDEQNKDSLVKTCKRRRECTGETGLSVEERRLKVYHPPSSIGFVERLRQELCKRDQAAILSAGASMATPSLYSTPR